MKRIINAIITASVIGLTACGPKTGTFEPLFNGHDFTGWETYIGVPDSSVNVPGMERDANGHYTQPVGTDKDPLAVFTVVTIDGASAIRASGQINGSLATKKEYGNYHLRLQQKWGEAKWAPRADLPRNSGVLYHGYGEFGQGLGVWKSSHECQVQENMFGDSYRMGQSWADISARQTDGRYVYDPAAEKLTFGPGEAAGPICARSLTNEKPLGEWNTIEVYCFGDTAIHVINGKVNMRISGSRIKADGKETSLRRGVIQLQSEGAEVYYRNIEICPIEALPAEILK